MPYKSHEMRKMVWRNAYWKHPFKRLAKYLKREDKTTTVTPFDLFKLARKQRMKCALSGRRLINESISVDHITHLFKGGKTTLDNLRLVSKEVNLARHTMTDENFIKMCQDVVHTNMPHTL